MSVGKGFFCALAILGSESLASSETQGHLVGAGGNILGKEVKRRMFTCDASCPWVSEDEFLVVRNRVSVMF